ncbi:PAS domain S-box-containing protein [Flavobacterium sp. PL11]|uniref:PAS domain S-box protein n=1 Tax=Flavobacterium sp. PL11 TaxID=3071717 RepID=UPI002E0B54B0|nr:PAS domain S-box-containing protein [Flavobacterium sp. PL11]
MINKEKIFTSAPFGYALLKIVLDKNGTPVDYEFIEVNEAFENLSGLQKNNIIGKKVKEDIPKIDKVKFDSTSFYEKIAPNSAENFELYSQALGNHYSVHSYSPEKNYLVVIFNDITYKINENSRLTTIIHNTEMGLWEWNVQTGETNVNEQWVKIIGYTLKELSPISIDTWIKLTHPDDLQKSNELLNAHFEGKTAQYRCEVRIKHKDGHWVWVLDTGKVAQWTDDGKPLLMSGVHQDIIERKQAEAQLYQKLELESLLSEISSEFIHSVDIDASIIKSFSKLAAITQPSRVYLFMLDAEKETMSNTHEWCGEGVSAEIDNLQNLPLSIFPWWMNKLYNKEIIHIPDVSLMSSDAKAEKDILENQYVKSVLVLPIYCETQLKAFVGFDNVLSSNLWSEKDAQLLNLFADIIANAIKRKINEQQLKLLTVAVKESPVNILITDINGTITYVNSSFEKTTGFKTHEVIGKNPSILNSGKQPTSFYKELWDTILAGKIWEGELRNKTKDGDIFWAKSLISPIKNNGQITHFVNLTQDISDNKKLISELLEAKLNAEESDRLKSAFLATVNHELRTPLNHVLGLSSLIPDITEDATVKEFSRLIHKSGSHLLNIIEDIFDLAMIEQSEIKIRKQDVLIRDIYVELKKQLQEILSESKKSDSISLEYKIDSAIITKKIITDSPKVIQVMSNIIKNAVKFTPEGKISLTVTLEKDNYLSIKLKDTGIGIPKDKLKIIFEFFRQVDDTHARNYEGVGIGLAISLKIAKVMGGTIKVESEPGIGTEFTFSFPVNLVENEIIEFPEENTSFLIPDFSANTVLIVEDDTTGMRMTMSMLNLSKCKIINAVNGQEAIDAIKENPAIDIILMDLKMPVMDGFDATRAIRNDFSNIPIIALTAYSLQKDKTKALDAGCNDIITKPINKEILFKILQQYLLK